MQQELEKQICSYLKHLMVTKAKHTDVDALEVAFECVCDGLRIPGESVAASDSLLSVFTSGAETLNIDMSPEARQMGNAEEADKLKAQGNQAFKNGSFEKAKNLFSDAIALCPSTPGHSHIYYANRAAVHSKLGAWESVVSDAKKATELDPSYAKAYHRLGLGLLKTGDVKGAVRACEKAVSLDPSKTNQNALAEAKRQAGGAKAAPAMDFSSLASMFGGQPRTQSTAGDTSASSGSAAPADPAALMETLKEKMPALHAAIADDPDMLSLLANPKAQDMMDASLSLSLYIYIYMPRT
ncbi:hypothetical protein KIPB_005998 [Kipferlia bialata]|uniref:SGTA homodimerisation domain-containing protein n=1 Tax=Kipferlia bialata TaxID=797122 RepID=A0A9K3CZG0_9EUKA|nr:hypothetical protein KIPB_005998 [Kipferlia bialata]|eukprot:g5998.t1